MYGAGTYQLTKGEFMAFSMFSEHGVNERSESFVRKFDCTSQDVDVARKLYFELKDKFPGVYNGL